MTGRTYLLVQEFQYTDDPDHTAVQAVSDAFGDAEIRYAHIMLRKSPGDITAAYFHSQRRCDEEFLQATQRWARGRWAPVREPLVVEVATPTGDEHFHHWAHTVVEPEVRRALALR